MWRTGALRSPNVAGNSTMNDILILDGCRPTPLASYLKALGILRLVAEQADSTARGFWQSERFHLKTVLDRDSLCRFFLNDYAPTPIIAPWNGRAGFLEGDSAGEESSDQTAPGANDEPRLSTREGAKLRRSYEQAIPSRFQRLRDAARAFASLPTMIEMDKARADWKTLKKKIGKRKPSLEESAELAALKNTESRAKEDLVAALRNQVDEEQYAWLDVCIRLAESRGNSPLLIGGGADGSRDYGMAFGSALHKLFGFDDGLAREGEKGPWLRAALFGEAAALEDRDSFGHFYPGQSGYNATTGYEGSNPLNPWDVALTLEGGLIWSGGVTRRLENSAESSASSFPFSFTMNRSGAGQLSAPDQNRAPGEIWCPIWSRPVGLPELRGVFREGRLTIGKRAARSGLDAALAVAALGRSRGMTSFIRVGIYQSDAKMPHTATSLRRHIVGSAQETASLAVELADHWWLAKVRREARAKGAPAALRGSVRAIEDALFELTTRPQQAYALQRVLIEFGRLGRIIADRPRLHESLSPPPRLSRAWAAAADDTLPEFRLAAALAALHARIPRTGSAERIESQRTGAKDTVIGLHMRQHLAPLDLSVPIRPEWSVQKGGSLAVWGARGLIDNLCLVAQRRLLEASRLGLRDKPFDAPAGVAVDSASITTLLEGSEDISDRVADLIAGLAWVEPVPLKGDFRVAVLPFAYAALKPLFATSASIGRASPDLTDLHLPMPPQLSSLLMSGRVDDALRLGQERARASGLPTPFLSPRRSGAARRLPDVRFGRRLLAALMVPVVAGVLRDCLNQAYPSDKEIDDAA